MFEMIRNLTVNTKILANSLILLGFLAVSSLYSLYSVDRIGVEIGSIANRDVPLIATFNQINYLRLSKSIHFERANRFALNAMLDSEARAQLESEVEQFKAEDIILREQFKKAESLFEESLATAQADQKSGLEESLQNLRSSSQLLETLNETSNQVFVELIDGQIYKATALLDEVETLNSEFSGLFENLISAVTQQATSSTVAANNHEKSTIQITAVLGGLSLLVGLLLSFLLIRNIKSALGADPSEIRNIATAIAAGDLNVDINTDREKACGVLLEMMTMRNNLRDSIEKDRAAAAENQRIKQALDNVSSSIMVADPDNIIIYANDAAISMFKTAEEDFRQDLPGFNADGIVGESIGRFHLNPSDKSNLLEKLKEPHKAELIIGGRSMNISASPVMNESGDRLGTVVEWEDRTSEVAIETEIEQIIVNAQKGDLSQRMNTENKEGFFRTLSMGMNQLIHTVSEVFDQIASTMQAMSQGDLNNKMSGNYKGTFADVQQNVNTTIEELQKIVGSIRKSTDLIAAGSDEISSGNMSLSERTEQQAASLEETASAMEEITSTVRQNADNSQQANQLSNGAKETAQSGGTIVANAIHAMQEINDSSSRIADIVTVIDEIAFQTNLLALNASVEAARAGEQGRGFAVVATEVRNLAQRSAGSAKEIKDLIQDSVEKVEAGSKLVNESGEALEEIVTAVIKVSDIVAEITTASEEQASGIDQVNKTVTSLDDLTQQNAALAEETSAASTSMNQHAREMISQVEFFKLDGSVPTGSNSTGEPVVSKADDAVVTRTPQSKVVANAPNVDQDDEWAEF